MYRTHKSSGYGYECPTELTEVPGTGMKVLTELREVPGIVARAYRTYRSFWYGYECPTELAEVPGTGNTRVNAHPVGGGFDSKWRIQSNLHHG